MRAIALFSFLLTLVATPIVIVVLRRLHVFDVPNERSAHARPVLRGGGIAVFLGATGGLLLAGILGVPDPWSLKTLTLSATVFAAIGFADDLRQLDARLRLFLQVTCAVVLIGPWFYDRVPIDGTVLRLAAVATAIVWVVGFLNAFNFMDGINGISSLHAIVGGLAFAYIGHVEATRTIEVPGVLVASAALAFLPFNFPRARVFLGDVGSYFLGTWLAVTALICIAGGIPPEAALAPFLIYLADTGFTLLDRIRRKQRWYSAHREHVYQQLNDLGWSHTLTAVVVTGFSVVCTALGLTSLTGSTGVRLASDVALVVVVVAYLFLPRMLRSIRPLVIDGSANPATSSGDAA